MYELMSYPMNAAARSQAEVRREGRGMRSCEELRRRAGGNELGREARPQARRG